MNECYETPTYIVATLQAGFHEPGWKSDIEKQIFLSGWKRPEGVSILIPGGLKGYSEGNITTPWYSPPAYGLSGGPRYTIIRQKKVNAEPQDYN